MLEHLNIEDILFIDIETVPLAEHFEDVPESLKPLWDKKARQLIERAPERFSHQSPARAFEEEAGIFAEFGKVICISVGIVTSTKDEPRVLRLHSFAHPSDEKALLEDFASALNKLSRNKKLQLCGHNIREFDIPFIARRMLINRVKLPSILDIGAKKPWELNFIDTLNLWKFGDFKHFTTLSLLCAVLEVPTPKDDIDGSQVASVFYKDKNLKRITTYCEKDVIAVTNLLLRIKGEPLLSDNQTVSV